MGNVIDFDKAKRIREDFVKTKINPVFKQLSELLQDSTYDYALFRGKIQAGRGNTIVLDLLASKESGAWKKVSLEINAETYAVLYGMGDKPFKNELKIAHMVIGLVTEKLDCISDPFDAVYFDLNHTVPIMRGYLGSNGKENYLVLSNAQNRNSNYCFPDALPVVRDKMLVNAWGSSSDSVDILEESIKKPKVLLDDYCD